uniref:Uncharacterized protein n=1 Tax=Glossina morsitans morsitans TaxID=37546 RepID=A0A1B0G8E7_GLOMM
MTLLDEVTFELQKYIKRNNNNSKKKKKEKTKKKGEKLDKEKNASRKSMRFMLHVKFALRNGGTFQCRIHWKDSIVQIGTISNIKKQLCVSSNLIAIKIAIQEDDLRKSINQSIELKKKLLYDHKKDVSYK